MPYHRGTVQTSGVRPDGGRSATPMIELILAEFAILGLITLLHKVVDDRSRR
jgi:hypothetical protein